MGKKLLGVYYETANGSCPVEEWLNKQSVHVQAKMQRNMDLLEANWDGTLLNFVRSLGDGLFEIRAEIDKKWPRIIYFYCYQDRIVYLHGFLKKTNRTPDKEIDIAKSRRKDFYKQEENDNEN